MHHCRGGAFTQSIDVLMLACSIMGPGHGELLPRTCRVSLAQVLNAGAVMESAAHSLGTHKALKYEHSV